VNPAQYGDDPIEVEGPAGGIDRASNRFTMNGLTIEYTDKAFAGELSEDTLALKTYYEVEGKLVGGVLQASRIQPDDFRRYQKNGKDIELAGPVLSDYDSKSLSFSLNGLTIHVTPGETELEDLSSFNDLKTGLLVQVEGEFTSATDIQANEIEVREGDTELEGDIDDGTVEVLTAGRFTGRFEAGGLPVVTTSHTVITDDESDERLGVGDLRPPAAGQFVSVEMSGLEKKDEFGNFYIEALQIERTLSDKADSDYELEGRLESISGQIIRMLSIRIDTSTATFDGTTLEDLNSRLQSPAPVMLEVEYQKTPVNTGFRATRIELND
jgi:hypothetical protein